MKATTARTDAPTTDREPVQIATRRFGTIHVAADEQFLVPRGIPGFATLRRAALLAATAVPAGADAGTDAQSLFWLQDLDDGELAFLCVVPWDLFPDYDLEIDEDELGIADSTDVRILNLVTVRRAVEPPSLTVNLRAPIVLDVRRRELHQTILNDQRWPISAPVSPATSTGTGTNAGGL